MIRLLACLGVAVAALAAPPSAGQCPVEPIHTYVWGMSIGWSSTTAGASFDLGTVKVQDTNVQDCDQDGNFFDFDGDYDTGVGGAFFGHGPWATEPTCDYDLNTYGPSVYVDDTLFGPNVAFVMGEDDQTGPVVFSSMGQSYCETDGAITPFLDSDDCLTDANPGTWLLDPYIGGWGRTCGSGGGDGGYWVFLYENHPMEIFGSYTDVHPATAGTVTAFPTGAGQDTPLGEDAKTRARAMHEVR